MDDGADHRAVVAQGGSAGGAGVSRQGGVAGAADDVTLGAAGYRGGAGNCEAAGTQELLLRQGQQDGGISVTHF